jgi:hypothetical protein
MREARTVAIAGVLVSVLLGAACGGGSDGGGVVQPAACVNFTAAQAPGAGKVVAREAAGSTCSARTIEVIVTDVSDVFAAGFVAAFDPARVRFVSASANGSFLAAGGAQVNLQAEAQGGGVTVGISRVGTSTGANAAGSQVLVRLTFAPVAAGASQLSLNNGQLFGSETPPQPKAGLTWSGGSFVVQ